jgi:hypothetical protein
MVQSSQPSIRLPDGRHEHMRIPKTKRARAPPMTPTNNGVEVSSRTSAPHIVKVTFLVAKVSIVSDPFSLNDSSQSEMATYLNLRI